jgi:hypothetical protein
MTLEILTAINKFENTLRIAVRKDTIAENNETWETGKLKACEEAWEKHREARVELEAAIVNTIEGLEK